MFQGQIAATGLQVIFAVIIVYMIQTTRKGGKLPDIRRLAGMDAMDEAIGRATEMGRPVMYSPGLNDVNNAQTLASFSVLGYVSRFCARMDTRLIVGNYIPTVQSITEEIVHESYVAENKGDRYDPTSVRFISSGWGSYASGFQGTMRREQVAASLYIGAFYAEAMMLSEVGSLLGAIQVAATANTTQIPFFVAACDYCLIGEELYAAGAYLSHDPVLKANLIALDWGKMFAAAVIVIGALMATMGNSSLATILKK